MVEHDGKEMVEKVSHRLVFSSICRSMLLGSIAGLIFCLFFTLISELVLRNGASEFQSSMAVVVIAITTFSLFPNGLEQWFGQSKFAMIFCLSLSALAVHQSYRNFGLVLTLLSTIFASSISLAFVSVMVQIFFLVIHYLFVNVALPILFKPFATILK